MAINLRDTRGNQSQNKMKIAVRTGMASPNNCALLPALTAAAETWHKERLTIVSAEAGCLSGEWSAPPSCFPSAKRSSFRHIDTACFISQRAGATDTANRNGTNAQM